MLVLHRDTGRIDHRIFRDIGEYLKPGGCLVLNNTRVLPARFFCHRRSGGRVETLFLRATPGTSQTAGPRAIGDDWLVLFKPSARLKKGERLRCVGADVELVVQERRQRGHWLVRPEPSTEVMKLLERIGQPPLPPYIRCDAAGRTGAPDAADRDRYQTVYAQHPGAVAAPTAGLHFTTALLDRLKQSGVRTAEVTLHVGLGTFAPIEVDDLAQHRMHAEWFDVSEGALATLREVRRAGRRIVAVGTTSVRVLESLESLEAGATAGWTDIFIYPPYRCRHVDALLTNFHLPGSTLLALVMAFASPELIRRAYAEAIERRYRFYSYGDAMLVL